MANIKVKKRLAINPDEARVVRMIYDWYLSNMGAKAIAERLNVEGHSYRGKRWSKNRILDIIGDEAYIGRYYFNKTDSKSRRLKPKDEWVTIPVEAIIDEDTWFKARQLKIKRSPAKSRRNPAVESSKTVLTGIAVCGLCGAGMALETAKAGRYTYYNCANYFRKGRSTCPGQRIPAKSLEQAVIRHLITKLFTKQRIKQLLKGIYKEMQEADRQNDNHRKSLVRRLDVIQNRLNRQYEAIESGVIDLQDVAERIRELKGQREQLEHSLQQLKRPRAIPLHLFKDESIATFQRSIKSMFIQCDDRRLVKRYLQLFIEKIVINLPRVEIVAKPAVILAVLENKTAVRTDGVLTAVGDWLPMTYNCKNIKSTIILPEKATDPRLKQVKSL
jgi:site-specific DNA recombinase